MLLRASYRPVYRPVGPILLAVVSLVLFLARPAHTRGLAALVTDAQGRVEIQRPGQSWLPASIMTSVTPGSQIKVHAGGRATLSFVQGGVKARLVGPVTAGISPSGATVTAGSPSNVQMSRPSASTAMKVPNGVDIDRMAGTLVRAYNDDLILYTGPALLTAQPTIVWRNGRDSDAQPDHVYDQYRVLITDASGAKLFDQRVAGTARKCTLPAGKVVAGGRCRLTLTASAGGADVARVTRDLTVLDAAVREGVEKAQKEAESVFAADPGDVTPLALLTGIYLEKQLDDLAIAQCTRILAKRPRAEGICGILSSLYGTIGQRDKAAVLKKRADRR